MVCVALLAFVPFAASAEPEIDLQPKPQSELQADVAVLSARDMLARQSYALAETNYTGLLTYEHGAHLSTMQITHRVIDGFEHEQLQHLNGERREVLRNGDNPKCLSAADRLLRGRWQAEDKSTSDIDQRYHISIIGAERIAGREAHVVQVMPRDQHRYGYVVSIDKVHFLPLKVLLIGPGARVLERFQYANLEVEGNLDFSQLAPTTTAINCPIVPVSDPLWNAEWLPDGFVLAGVEELTSRRHMQMYTDGLAAFSIFFDRLDEPAQLAGHAQRGATVAYLGNIKVGQDNYRLTVVGEVPTATLDRVANSLRARGSR